MKRKIKDSAVRLFLFNLLKNNKKEFTIIITIATFGSVLTVFILLPGKIIINITKMDAGDAYVNKRMEIWESAVNIIKEKPILGTGPDNFIF